MNSPFDLAFTNIVFFYPAFREEDRARQHLERFGKTLHRAVAHRTLGKRGFMIYVHIPFCSHICRFCGYHRKRLTSPEALSSYVDRLLAEIREWSSVLDGPRQPVSHLYFGGGTPTLLPPPDFLRLADALRESFAIPDGTEFDMESDMDALQDPGKLKMYRSAGVTRISVGVQSFDQAVRGMAGIDRGRGKGDLYRGFGNLRDAGYGINYDLMFGLPGQSTESFLADVRRSADEVAADHVDLLEFFPQSEAYFTRHFEEYEKVTADRETRRTMYSEARAFLLGNGFSQDTLTDFWQARLNPGSFKAMLYRNADILGLGAGSCGILADCAYRNAGLGDGYLEEPWDSPPLAFIRPMSASLLRTRSLVLLPKLISFSEADFPGGITEKERAFLDCFKKQGLLEQKEDAFLVTEAGMLNSAEMMLEIVRKEGL